MLEGAGEGAFRANTEMSRFHTVLRSKGTASTSTSRTHRHQRRRFLVKAKPVDMHVGRRMRQRRTLLAMSQSKVGEAVGSPSSRSRSTSAAPTASVRAGFMSSPRCSTCRVVLLRRAAFQRAVGPADVGPWPPRSAQHVRRFVAGLRRMPALCPAEHRGPSRSRLSEQDL